MTINHLLALAGWVSVTAGAYLAGGLPSGLIAGGAVALVFGIIGMMVGE